MCGQHTRYPFFCEYAPTIPRLYGWSWPGCLYALQGVQADATLTANVSARERKYDMEILLILLGIITAVFDLSLDEFLDGLSFIFEFF